MTVTEHRESSDRTVDLVLAACRALLGVDDLVASDSFFEVGGDSLTAVALVMSLADEHGIEIPLETVFISDSLADIASGAVT